MAFRLVVVDLDGTARSRTLGITPGVQGAVRRAQARGVRVCVATGRMWRSAAPWVARLHADSPAILYNGGQVLDWTTGTVLEERRLPRAAAGEALALVGRNGEVQPHLFLHDRVYVSRPHPWTDAYAADDGLAYEIVPDLPALLAAGDPHKLLIVGEPARLEALGQAVREAALPVHAVQSEPRYLEVLPRGVSKGSALPTLCGVLGVAPHEVLAVGDGWNDLEMIEAAGLGVAMGHAPPGVRARAGFVCGTAEEDGVREVIERFVLAEGAAGRGRPPA